jgi:hypothetical protein
MCFWTTVDHQCSCGFGSYSRARLPDLSSRVAPGKDAVLWPRARGTARWKNGHLEFGAAASGGKGAERDPDFLHEAPKKFACAAFSTESRMKFANANKLDRKSGGRTRTRICLPKWYWAMTPFEETVAP